MESRHAGDKEGSCPTMQIPSPFTLLGYKQLSNEVSGTVKEPAVCLPDYSYLASKVHRTYTAGKKIEHISGGSWVRPQIVDIFGTVGTRIHHQESPREPGMAETEWHKIRYAFNLQEENINTRTNNEVSFIRRCIQKFPD